MMERAGYIVPSSQRAEGTKHGSAATFSIDNLSAEEESVLLEYLNYIRSKANAPLSNIRRQVERALLEAVRSAYCRTTSSTCAVPGTG
jgi:hypothetical protein